MNYQQSSGHWANLLRANSDLAALPADVREAPLQGFLKRTRLRDYAPDALAADLDWCARGGYRLILMLEDKTFVPELPVADALAAYCPANGTGGYTAIRWMGPIREDFAAKVESVYRDFGNHLAFEGLALQETALGLDKAVLDRFGYTPDLYADTYLDLVRRVDALPLRQDGKRLFWHQNYFARDPRGVAIERVLLEAGPTLALGGPDLWPADKQLVEQVYPRYSDARFDHLTKFTTFSAPSFDQPGFTLEQVYDYGVDELGASYVFWTYRQSLWPQALAVMQEARWT